MIEFVLLLQFALMKFWKRYQACVLSPIRIYVDVFEYIILLEYY